MPPTPHATGPERGDEPPRLFDSLRRSYTYLPKDFVETPDGLVAAVVSHGVDVGRVLAYPRYLRQDDGTLNKLSDAQSQLVCRSRFPAYSYFSQRLDVSLTGIPIAAIFKHFCPNQGLATLFAAQWDRLPEAGFPFALTSDSCGGSGVDRIAQLRHLLGDLSQHVGITGSYLIAANRFDSDLDLVVYGLSYFHQLRQRFAAATVSGELARMTETAWRAAYDKRGAIDLSYEEYRWHEQRKLNKFLLGGVKLDLSCVDQRPPALDLPARKLGPARITARVVDDRYGFATPAVLQIDHEQFRWIVMNTATYVGQATVGEVVEAVGTAEVDADGVQRLVVGASRGAAGELVRVT